MLNNFFLKSKFINFFKNNFYLDYLIKLIFKKFLYNTYIYLGFFFAEKFIIEYNTKYIYNYVIYKSLFFFKTLHFSKLYIYLFISFFNLVLIFF
jgi:hypothetical protein